MKSVWLCCRPSFDSELRLYKERDPESGPEGKHNLALVQEMGPAVPAAGYDQRNRVLRTRLNISDIVVDAHNHQRGR